MNKIKQFELERDLNIKKQGKDSQLKKQAIKFVKDSAKYQYSYNFSWLGRPIIQFPQDILAMQELIWKIKPDLIIETGIAHGGSIIFSASMLDLIGKGQVLGIDIDIREHNLKEINKHLMSKRIKMLEGSSIDPDIIEKVKSIARGKKKILVFLDSNHSHEHVLNELRLYSPFVSKDSYIVVFDTVVEYLPKHFVKNRNWDKGDNPKTAVDAFLKENKKFELDTSFDDKLLITAALGGFLKRIK